MGKRLLKKLTQYIRGIKGTTLLEVLVASTILTISMLGVAGMFIYSSKNFNRGRQEADATLLAGQKISCFRNMSLVYITSGYDQHSTTNGVLQNIPPNVIFTPGGHWALNGTTTYSRYWNVTAIHSPPGIPLKRIKVFVTWTGRGHFKAWASQWGGKQYTAYTLYSTYKQTHSISIATMTVGRQSQSPSSP